MHPAESYGCVYHLPRQGCRHLHLADTPGPFKKRMDSFCVVVESKEDNPDLPSSRRHGKGTGVSGGELVVAEDCNELQGLVGMASTANIMDEYRRSPRPTLPLKSGTPGGGLFRNVPSLTGLWQQQRHWSGLRTQSEKAREMQESWEMALTLLGKEEEGERKAIALDESSSWITLKWWRTGMQRPYGRLSG
ncbi:hypothetical protein TcBrA4_0126290 [Trypanosoma cruzi]|nr:hypothetical protein TcBrA4_0126290 [Trypanosoma cruzi]